MWGAAGVNNGRSLGEGEKKRGKMGRRQKEGRRGKEKEVSKLN